MSDSKFDVNKISIRHVELIGFSISNLNEGVDKDDIEGYRFENISDSAFNLDVNMAKVELTINIEGLLEDNKSSGASGSFKFDFLFDVENLLELTKEDGKEDEIKVEPILGMTLLGLSYSTARGIILTRSLGTSLEGVILPVVNPASMNDSSKDEEE